MSAPKSALSSGPAAKLLLLALIASYMACDARAGSGPESTSPFLRVGFSPSHDALTFLGVDSLGQGKVGLNVLAAQGPDAPRNEGWRIGADARSVSIAASGAASAYALTLDTHACYGTLLGTFDVAGSIRLPAVLHLPGFGALRIRAGAPGAAVGYTAASGWVRVTFPPADPSGAAAAYTLEVAAIYPRAAAPDGDPRFDGLRRNWLNVLQLNPTRRVLSNNTSSDTCGFCYYEYADIARLTPPLADGLEALDVVRQSMDAVLSGTKTYGMPGYGDFPVESSDLFPSLLIAADDCVEGRGDWSWLEARYGALRAMAERMLATDTTGDGLVKYAVSGNSGIWNEGMPKVRPSNWWDTIGFGWEDAYANALAYRALGGMSRMAAHSGRQADAARYSAAAQRLKAAYFKAFLDPSTGVLAGWRSEDGQLHDYYFLWVNSIAVLYGLVPEKEAGPIMDRLWNRMAEAGYSRFRMGLPGNLVPVPRRDYAHKHPRWGGGVREDNQDGFQVYENGGATACFSYFTIAALTRVGRRDRADAILLPVLDAFDKREFEGTGANGMTNDWRTWEGDARGYEGFLVDNYYTLMAAAGVAPDGTPQLPPPHGR